MSNATLMATIATGTRAESDAAFARLVELFQGPITGYAHKILRDWDAAEDIFQSVMLTVFRHAGNFREIERKEIGQKGQAVSLTGTLSHVKVVGTPTSSFQGWIYSICRRRCIDAIRKRKHDALSLSVSPTDEYDPLSVVAGASRLPLDSIVEREEIDEITVAMDAIPDAQRAVFELACEGYSFPEIAEASGLCVKTVTSQARMAKEKLRARFDPIIVDCFEA